MLLYDERNPMFLGEGACYSSFLGDLSPDVRGKCHALTIQQVVGALEDQGALPSLLEFQKKYL